MMLSKLKVGFVVALLGFASQCPAQIVTLHDGNSVAQINTASQAGMFYWGVQNSPDTMVNQLAQQWFWYRLGNDPERSIDTISAPQIVQSSPGAMTSLYHDPLQRFTLGITYTLRGGLPLSGAADIAEQISINNISGAALDFHFFQYSDFDLAGTGGNDSVLLSVNGFTHRINQADQTDGTSLAEVVNTPNASHGEAAFFPATLNRLNDGLPTTLNDNLLSENGDVTWALQWDFNLPAGGSFLISKDKSLSMSFVPEPSALALVAVGLLTCALRRRRH
jgi:large repetitive protein